MSRSARPALVSPSQEPVIRQLVQGWDEARGDQLTPPREAIRARPLAAILGNIVMVEFRPPETAILTMIGQTLNGRGGAGRELTGLNVFDTLSPSERPIRATRWTQCATLPCGMYYFMPFVMEDRLPGTIEQIFLPLTPTVPGAYPFIGAAVTHTPHDPEAFDPSLVSALPWDRVASELSFIDIGAGVPRDEPVVSDS